MPTKEIPNAEWPGFFDSFSRRHRGWLVTMEAFGPEIGDQIEARELPLEGVTLESNDPGRREIDIFIGSTPDSRISHKIVDATHVRVKQTDGGADEVLEIESDGVTTLLRFRSAIQTELVDGLI
jgi:hypothetical protein